MLSRENDYAMYLYTCNRCRTCAVEPSPEHRAVCPSYRKFGFFAYSGGGRGYVAQGIIEGKVPVDREAAEIAMNCLMCGACAHACPPGFDINNFIRDLRDHLVRAGVFVNEAHQKMLTNCERAGNPWGRALPASTLPEFTGSEELLVWLGCQERKNARLTSSVTALLDAAGVSYGVLADEPCCGAPLLDLGAREAYEEQVKRVIATVEESGAERMLVLCPHCAAAFGADYVEVGDLTAEPVSLPALLAELVADERISFGDGPDTTVTYHDPCRLARWLDEVEPAREVLAAMPGVELIEMDRSGEWGWCCGAGGWASEIVPELASFTAAERVAEARATGADKIVTGCSYCTRMLAGKSGRKQGVEHIVELAAGRLKK